MLGRFGVFNSHLVNTPPLVFVASSQELASSILPHKLMGAEIIYHGIVTRYRGMIDE